MSFEHAKKVPIAIEDRFVVFGLGKGLAAHEDDADEVFNRFQSLKGSLDSLTPVFDLRDTEDIYNDIGAFINCFGQENPIIVIPDEHFGDIWHEQLVDLGYLPIRASGRAYPQHELDLTVFGANPSNPLILEDEPKDVTITPKDIAEIARIGEDQYCRNKHFEEFLRGIQKRSLLSEIAIEVRGDQVVVSPYHSSALYQTTFPSEITITARPAVFAKKTAAIFSTEVAELEAILDQPGLKEHRIQSFFEKHSTFLSGLNYQNVYPQVILERSDGTSLRPDFFLEPLEGDFCDILDLKLPGKSLFVGGRDRVTLAHSIHSVVAQLREYAAYFEEEKHRKLLLQKYGLKAYRPRLIAVVGRDLRNGTDEQKRRALTQYADCKIMTFDELLQHSRRRILL